MSVFPPDVHARLAAAAAEASTGEHGGAGAGAVCDAGPAGWAWLVHVRMAGGWTDISAGYALTRRAATRRATSKALAAARQAVPGRAIRRCVRH
jgi:hypothetical protein